MQFKKDIDEQVLQFSVMLCISMLAPILLVVLWPIPAAVYLTWDWANFLGFLSLAICGFLFVYRGRTRTFPAFSSRFFANLHRQLGYIALGLLAAHIGVLLIAEPLLLEHLKPTAPLHMLAGLAATILMLALVISSVPYVRRRLWHDYHVFRHIHAVLAVSLVALVAIHVIGSGFYINTDWKVGLAAVVGVGLLAHYVIDSRNVPEDSIQRTGNSSRYSSFITYTCATLVVLACLLLALAMQFL